MRTKLTLIATLLVTASVVGLGGIINPLDVGLGVRAMGLGGAYTALAQGSEALLYNPAGLSRQQSLQADSSYTNSMGLYGVGWLAGAAPSLGGGVAYMSVGDIVDPGGAPLAYSQFTLVVGGGLDARNIPFLAAVIPPTLPMSLGGNLKIGTARMADASGTGIALDLAAQARFPTGFGEIGAGLAVRDLGFGLAVGDEGGGWSTELAAGVSLTHPIGGFGALEVCGRYIGLGVGWKIEPVEIRGGIQFAGEITRWTLGLGVAWEQFALDYALMTHPDLGISHRLGFGVNLGDLLGM